MCESRKPGKPSGFDERPYFPSLDELEEMGSLILTPDAARAILINGTGRLKPEQVRALQRIQDLEDDCPDAEGDLVQEYKKEFTSVEGDWD